LEVYFLIRPHQGWAPQRNTRHVRKLGAPTQCNARLQVGRPNARPQRKCKARPHVRNLGAPTQCKARPEVGHPNATQGELARWAPKRKTHPQRKRPHKGALGEKMSWRMDKNKFWLGGILFNMASPRLGAPMQREVRPQDGRPNATQGASARWAPKRKTDPQRKHPHKGALG
jgi:hypothetical protein